MSEKWRLLLSPALSTGPANMALDESMAVSVAQGQKPPTLRIYGWNSRTISIGRFQSASDIAWEAAQEQGVEVVRRPTGGRALLHAEEVTYAVALPQDHSLAAEGVLETYRRISQGLVAALEHLGLGADPLVASRRLPGRNSAACFEIPSAYEVTVKGRKLIGSAQCSREGYVLQHGSIPIEGNQSELVSFLEVEEDAREQLRVELHRKSTTLAFQAKTTLGKQRPFSRKEVVEALVAGFQWGLKVDLEEATTDPHELECASALIRRKYANDTWTLLK